MEHGYYFEELGFLGEPSVETAVRIFEGGSFPFDLTRRKVTSSAVFSLGSCSTRKPHL